jgi:hypothetical protein
VAYKLNLPTALSKIHDVFHVSQLKKCFWAPSKVVHQFKDLSFLRWSILSWGSHQFFDQAERKTRRKATKFLKVWWSNHTVDEATWECEDHLKFEFPSLFSHPQ